VSLREPQRGEVVVVFVLLREGFGLGKHIGDGGVVASGVMDADEAGVCAALE
jgi:hypothetical protein